jgi:hypothetical protein
MAASLQALREKFSKANLSAQVGGLQSAPQNAPRMSAKISAPVPVLPPGLALLLELETKIRATTSLQELQYLIANESGVLAGGSQVYILSNNRLGNLRIVTAAHAVKVDKTAPLILAYEKLVKARLADANDAPHDDKPQSAIGPFSLIEHEGAVPKQALILPLQRGDKQLGALFFVGEFALKDSTMNLLVRLADTTAHAWDYHQPKRAFQLSRRSRRWAALLGFSALALISLIPVPMTALAPMRVVTIEPTIISAPIDGVIDELLVRPNDAVKSGAPLLRYVELTLAAKAEAAERELAVSDAKFKRVSMVALSNIDAKRELAIVEAELSLKRAERDFALDQLKRSRVLSPVDGIALFGDKKDWVGRPVVAGERILELGDASNVELQLELPVEDAIAMSIGQTVSAFLDTAPLSPLSAEVTRINHEPRPIEGRGLSFIIHARITDGQKPPLGVRGTAHIRGELVALGLFLLRRPISSFRQWAGV